MSLTSTDFSFPIGDRVECRWRTCAISLEFDAVYENGVLRPTTPLPFAERQEVRVRVDAVEPPEPQKSPTEVRSRIDEWRAKWAEIVKMVPPGLTNVDDSRESIYDDRA